MLAVAMHYVDRRDVTRRGVTDLTRASKISLGLLFFRTGKVSLNQRAIFSTWGSRYIPDKRR